MKLVNLKINNFRGIRNCDLYLPTQVVLVGDNNTGKSTILEAIDLVLGPERLSRRPVIDEHDFYAGEYLDGDNNPIDIRIEAVITDLDMEQQVHFRNNIEWWNPAAQTLIQEPPPEATDLEGITAALRVGFCGYYDVEEDDFIGETFYMSPEQENGKREAFKTKDKRICGFLYLRTLRTGNRALSLERGSLLDIILKLRELKPRMWEDVLAQLRDISVASSPELGVSEILTSVQSAVRELVPVECADAPAIRVSQLTREHLRQILTVFLGTGTHTKTGKEYAAPFHHQGTGTINTLVLSLLSMIAELKQNVIFAMEEPEIAIPPHTQKRIIGSVIGKSAQAIFTSHSPYVLEEFDPAQIIVIDRKNGELKGIPALLPPAVKQKMYRDEVKRRFCEALLARRVLIVEGRTEYDTFSRLAKKLQDIDSSTYSSLESLGIAVISADTDSQVAPLGAYFRVLEKTTYAIFDKQDSVASKKIRENIDYPYESTEKGFEDVLLNNIPEAAVRRYTQSLITDGLWATHQGNIDPKADTFVELKTKLSKYFKTKKAEGTVADCLCICTPEEIPSYILDTLKAIRNTVIAVPTNPEIAPTLFRLTYTCGLRPNESRELLRENVNLKSGEVLITHTKRNKERLIVMSDDMLKMAQAYDLRRGIFGSESPYFFPSSNGKAFPSTSVYSAFNKAWTNATCNAQNSVPRNVRVYDLRHRFASACLNRWLDNGENLMAMLPYLRTYMGHATMNETAYYIHILPENLVKSSAIDWDAFNSMFPAPMTETGVD
ncbi:hypothetical protein FACS189490_11220 [Clostridia bacterium]|nr:hypothetical protein FACS189490_11220 [Clostridia bacterium]